MASKSGAISRLKKEYQRVVQEPIPSIETFPLENNIFEWHFVLNGPADSVFAGGQYYGRIVFPPEYPFRPPTLYMMTPSACFEPNKPICMSMTDYHPETWNPLWSVSSILTGLLSFMLEPAPTVLAAKTSQEEKRQCAKDSIAWNMRSAKFKELFPHRCGASSSSSSAPPAEPADSAAESAAELSTLSLVQVDAPPPQSPLPPASSPPHPAEGAVELDPWAAPAAEPAAHPPSRPADQQQQQEQQQPHHDQQQQQQPPEEEPSIWG